VQALDPQPGNPTAEGRAPDFRAPTRAELRRVLGRLRVGGRWLDQCLGARAGAWFGRGLGLSFGMMALFMARPLPESASAVLRLLLMSLSWCTGLAALSLAGPALERSLDAGRALIESRGVTLAALRADRPLVLALWNLRKLGLPFAFVLGACVVATPDPWRAVQLLGLAAGAGVYLAALGAGLGVVAWLCHALGGTRGQSLLFYAVLVPELVSPAWPELPTLVKAYASLLDACLGLGFRS
jgi:hypothetical protein